MEATWHEPFKNEVSHCLCHVGFLGQREEHDDLHHESAIFVFCPCWMICHRGDGHHHDDGREENASDIYDEEEYGCGNGNGNGCWI